MATPGLGKSHLLVDSLASQPRPALLSVPTHALSEQLHQHRLPHLLGQALRQPALSFYGLEIVAARVDEARRVASVLGLAALHFAEQDLADAALRLPEGDVYFMYQPVNDETQARLLEQLAALAQSRPLTLVACSDPLQEELHERVRWLRRTRLLRTGTTSRRVVGLFQS